MCRICAEQEDDYGWFILPKPSCTIRSYPYKETYIYKESLILFLLFRIPVWGIVFTTLIFLRS